MEYIVELGSIPTQFFYSNSNLMDFIIPLPLLAITLTLNVQGPSYLG